MPQERNIFRSLTVEENLTAVARPGPWTLERVYELFPRLKERRNQSGGQLSGGEQQMLAIGRALVLNPRLLLLDEPTEGLAPIIVEELLRALRRLFVEEEMAGIVVEQHARKILPITDRAIVLDRGRIVFEASSASLLADGAPLERYLGVTAWLSGRIISKTFESFENRFTAGRPYSNIRTTAHAKQRARRRKRWSKGRAHRVVVSWPEWWEALQHWRRRQSGARRRRASRCGWAERCR